MPEVYSDYWELRKGPPYPAPSSYDSTVVIYADENGILHSLQPDGTDWQAGTGLPGSSVGALAHPWEASNPSVSITPDGVVFGPYADGAAAGGSLRYHGLDGQPFSAVSTLAFNMRYSDDDKHNEASPYLRVFMQDAQGAAHDAIFTPGSQPYPGLGEGPFQEFVATAGMWRFDSDDGSGGVPLADLLAQYGDQLITKLTITLGYTAGVNLTALLRWWQINSMRHTFIGQGPVVPLPTPFVSAETPVAAPVKPE